MRENVPQYMYISVPYILVGVRKGSDGSMLGLGLNTNICCLIKALINL